MNNHGDLKNSKDERHPSKPARKLLTLLSSFLLSVRKWTMHHPVFLCICLLCMLIFCLYYGKKVSIAIRTEDFDNESLPSHAWLKDLKEQFPYEDRFSIILLKQSGFTGEDLCKIKLLEKDLLNQFPEILSIGSAFDLRTIKYEKTVKDGEKIHYPKILDNPCQRNIDLNELKKHPFYEFYTNQNLNEFIINVEIAKLKNKTRFGIYDYKVLDKILQRARQQLPFNVISGGGLYFQASVLEGVLYAANLNLVSGFYFCSFFIFFIEKLYRRLSYWPWFFSRQCF